MEPLGIIEGMTSDGHIIVACSSVPEIGDTVFDGAKNRIGAVKKVMGPVDAPYASVLPDGKRQAPKGTKLYYQSRKNGKSKRRNGRN